MNAMPEITIETLFDNHEITSDAAATFDVMRATFKRAYTPPPHAALCITPAMYFLSALQWVGAMEFTYERGELETVAVHLGDADTREDQYAWVEEIENVARATMCAHMGIKEDEYTFARAQYFTQKFHMRGNIAHAESWVKWEFSVY